MAEMYGALPAAATDAMNKELSVGSGSTSDAEMAAYRNAIKGGSKALDSPTDRYLEYMRMFQEVDPNRFGQSGMRPPAPVSPAQDAMNNELSRGVPGSLSDAEVNAIIRAGQPPAPVSPAQAAADTTRDLIRGAHGAVENLDDFMSNLGAKVQGK